MLSRGPRHGMPAGDARARRLGSVRQLRLELLEHRFLVISAQPANHGHCTGHSGTQRRLDERPDMHVRVELHNELAIHAIRQVSS